MKADLIFLDLGGVIFEIDWSHTLQPLGLSSRQIEVVEKIRGWQDHHRFERGHIQADEFFSSMRELLEIEDHHDLPKAWNSLITRPLPGADRIFATFKGKIPLYALSNTNVTHHHFINERFPVIHRFDQVLTSYELGHRKPDREIYLAAAEEVGVKPERIVFVDDSLANVEAARSVGFQAFQTVNSPAETIRVLSEYLK